MNYYIIFWIVVIGGAFTILWYQGHLLRLSNYVRETRVELEKCTWPTWAELKGSTAVVMISMLLLGAFTFLMDEIFNLLVNALT